MACYKCEIICPPVDLTQVSFSMGLPSAPSAMVSMKRDAILCPWQHFPLILD